MQYRPVELIENRTYNVYWLHDQMKQGRVFIDHTFQRNYVWLERHQIRLIETILLGYIVPEIYLWAQEESAGSRYSIVDGQQRIGAIADFLDGRFTLKRKYLDNKIADYCDKSFFELPEKYKLRVLDYPFNIRLIHKDMDISEIHSLFLRLNATNFSLNPQELRKVAFKGKFLRLANEISAHHFWSVNNIFTTNQIRRMFDIQFISSVLMFFRFGVDVETNQSNINQAYDMFNEEYEEYYVDKEVFEKILEKLQEFINDSQSNMKFLRKPTHLYNMIAVIYYILRRFDHDDFGADYVERFSIFVKAHTDELFLENSCDSNVRELIKEYKTLNIEGTQNKTKKIKRINILKKLILPYN